jgi:hypothetical protein
MSKATLLFENKRYRYYARGDGSVYSVRIEKKKRQSMWSRTVYLYTNDDVGKDVMNKHLAESNNYPELQNPHLQWRRRVEIICDSKVIKETWMVRYITP